VNKRRKDNAVLVAIGVILVMSAIGWAYNILYWTEIWGWR